MRKGTPIKKRSPQTELISPSGDWNVYEHTTTTTTTIRRLRGNEADPVVKQNVWLAFSSLLVAAGKGLIRWLSP